jgi:hypothetical protein
LANQGNIVEESDRDGASWQEISIRALVGLCGHGHETVRAAASAEIQRRTAEGIHEFNEQAAAHAVRLIEVD